MKVLNLLATGDVGGIERLCEDISEKSEHDNYYAFLFREGVVYERMKKNKNNKVISCSHINGKVKLIVKYLSEFINKNNIDVVIVHHGGIKCNLVYLSLMKKNKIKFIRYLHGCYDNFSWGRGENLLKNYFADITMKKALKKSDIIICISKASMNSFLNKFNISSNKFKIVYNGINSGFYINQNRNHNYNNNNILYLVYVGRLDYAKGLDNFIDALYNLQNNIDFKFTIIGDGIYKKSLEQKVFNYKLNNKIIFLGRKDNVIEYLDNNDFFVYPSICEEGFGISVVEAMARGCIPIVSNKGGLPEVVDYDKNFIFNTKKDLENLIVRVSKMKEKKKSELSNKCMFLSRKYSINKTVDDLDKYIENIAK